MHQSLESVHAFYYLFEHAQTCHLSPCCRSGFALGRGIANGIAREGSIVGIGEGGVGGFIFGTGHFYLVNVFQFSPG